MGGGGKGTRNDINHEQLIRTGALVNRPDVYDAYGSSVWHGNDPENQTQVNSFNPEYDALRQQSVRYLAQGAPQYERQGLSDPMQRMSDSVLDRVGRRFGFDTGGGNNGTQWGDTSQNVNEGPGTVVNRPPSAYGNRRGGHSQSRDLKPAQQMPPRPMPIDVEEYLQDPGTPSFDPGGPAGGGSPGGGYGGGRHYGYGTRNIA